MKESTPKAVIVSIQNLHETHGTIYTIYSPSYIHYGIAPDNKLVKSVGKKEVEVQEVQKIFGIIYDNIDKDEKYYFLTLLALKYNLYTFTKRKIYIISNLMIIYFLIIALELDDYGRYDDNPLILNRISIGGFSRTFIGINLLLFNYI